MKKINKTQSEYFEATLQLRNLSEEMLEFVIDEMVKNKVHIANEKRHKDGVDFFISSNKFALKIGNALKKKYGGTLKKSRQLFSYNKSAGKDIYRVSVFFKALDFKPGDIVRFGSNIVRIRHLGKRLVGRDVKTGRGVNVELKSVEPEKLQIVEATVSKCYPWLEVIHPETFQSVKIENSKKTTKGNLHVVLDEDKVYMV
jgi:nonsense-mediated mRNA decay protein 3